MTQYKNLAELVGKENFLEKKDLLKLKGSKIHFQHYDDSVKDAVVYTDNNYDFALVYKAENDSSFVYISLTSEILGRRLNLKRHFVSARPPGFMFIHKGMKSTDKYALNDACYDSINLAFDKVHGDVLPKFDFNKLYSNVCFPSSKFSTDKYIRATEIPYVDPDFEKLIAKNKPSKVLSKEQITIINKKFPSNDKNVSRKEIRPELGINLNEEYSDSNDDYFVGLEFKNPIASFLYLFRSHKD